MMQRLINHTLAITSLLLLLCAGLNFAPAQASALGPIQTVAASNSRQDACQGLNQLGGGGCGGGQSTISKIASGAVSIISYIAGVIALIMIIVSGIRFMTSNGDASKVSAAKTALVYALIGIAIAGLAQILVRFVLSSAAGAQL